MGNWIVPAILAGISFFAYVQGVDVFQTFLAGAKKGAQTALAIAPTLIGMLTAVSMLRASGTIDCLGQIMRPALAALGIPPDCAALVLLKPISGSGGLALGTEVMRCAGVDSYAGRVAAVMLGASRDQCVYYQSLCGQLGDAGYPLCCPCCTHWRSDCICALCVFCTSVLWYGIAGKAATEHRNSMKKQYLYITEKVEKAEYFFTKKHAVPNSGTACFFCAVCIEDTTYENGEFLKLANGQITAGNFLTERLVIGEEALTGFRPSQPARTILRSSGCGRYFGSPVSRYSVSMIARFTS